jgi:hypothetical protein
VESDGHKLGFYGVTQDDDGLLPDKMFLGIDQTGRGLGRVLWEYAVQTARDLRALTRASSLRARVAVRAR